MSNKSKTSAARTAQPVPAGGPLPATFSSPISSFQFFSVSAFASVTLNNSYGTFYKHQDNTNPISVAKSLFTIICNKPSEEPVTPVTLP
jgi:hypothetical protein